MDEEEIRAPERLRLLFTLDLTPLELTHNFGPGIYYPLEPDSFEMLPQSTWCFERDEQWMITLVCYHDYVNGTQWTDIHSDSLIHKPFWMP